MSSEENQPNSDPSSQADPPPPPAPAVEPAPAADPASTPPPFDPSRMVGIIKRKALIKELAAVYHQECLAYCQELLELQKKWEETIDVKSPDDPRKETIRPSKRVKKTR